MFKVGHQRTFQSKNFKSTHSQAFFATKIMTEEHTTAELRKVKKIQFGLLSPDEIRAMSVCQVEHPISFENGFPKRGGLSDLRMGTCDRTLACESCAGSKIDCPGHFGHIELTRPMYNVGHMNTVLKVLRAVCFHCSKLLTHESRDTRARNALKLRTPQARLRAFVLICKDKKVCEGGDDIDDTAAAGERSGCGNYQPKMTRNGLKIYYEYPTSIDDQAQRGKQELPADKAYSILKRVSDDDCVKLGLDPKWARPDWMINVVLPVPPPAVRPAIAIDSVSRGEDDLTHKLADIVKANENLRKQELNGAPAQFLQEFVDLLQYHIATMLNNCLPGQPVSKQRSGRALKSVTERLKGKEGRIRGNLMGKRVDFSSRSVITPDPNLSIDQLGVPRSVAMALTLPEVVTPFNIGALQELVRNGPNELAGAKYVVRDDDSRLDLRYKAPGDVHLELGYRVERHLQDGDVVVFNRQPSLHRMSMMGHRVKIVPYSTFRLNLTVTTPYNADFDGDEMNMHIPQSLAAKAEVQELMMVPTQIISPQSNSPVMGIVQDSLLGARLLTMRDTFLTKEFVFNLLMWVKDFDGRIPVPAILKPEPLWTGKQMFSLILPDVNLNGKMALHPAKEKTLMSPGDTRVLVESGELLCGILCKKTLGRSQGGLVHVIFHEYGPEATKRFLNETQAIVNYWLLHHGFTVGIGDTVADESTMRSINQTITTQKNQVKDLIEQAQTNKLKALAGMTIQQTFEKRVNDALNEARDESGKLAQESLPTSNNVKLMVTAGSKGNFTNIAQMIACVGQQNVEGKRIAFGFHERTLPHFYKDDYGPESRGFVANSYLSGLTPTEFFFHAMGGREGLIDTAVKTSETGYIQRRLMKAMEDVGVRYDGTVRNSCGDVLQFVYGEDGMDGTAVESQSLDTLTMSVAELSQRFEWKIDSERFGDGVLSSEIIDDIRLNADVRLVLEAEFQQLVSDVAAAQEIFPDGTDRWPLPVNIRRLIWNAKKIYGIGDVRVRGGGGGGVTRGMGVDAELDRDWSGSDLHPKKVIEGVQRLSQLLVVVPGSDPLSVEAQTNATLLFHILLRSLLNSRRVLYEHRLTREAFDWVLGEIQSRFLNAKAAPGEMVGAIAAQSIGEPATQMTLNTFHFAGVSAKNVTLGVPRLKEIINVSKNIKAPSLTVYLKEEHARDAEAAKEIQTLLEYATLGSVASRTEIFYDPDPKNTVVEEDREFVSDYFDMPDEEHPIEAYSPWLLRIELDGAAMTDKKLSIVEIVNAISNEFAHDLSCVFTDDNAEKLVLRIRVINDAKDVHVGEEDGGDDDAEGFLRRIEQSLLSELRLRGVQGIKKVYMRDEKVTVLGANGKSTRQEWILDTEGINLLAVLSQPQVDATRTVSTSITETFDVLGIEACRAALLAEIRGVLGAYGLYVNYRHLAMLADVMTHRGHLMAITRHGINQQETGAFQRASFEQTADVLLDASQFGETNDLRGVTERIMLGMTAPVGTGAFDLVLDEDALKSAIELPQLDLQTATASYGDASYGAAYRSQAQLAMQSPGADFGADTPMYAMTPGASPFDPRGAAFSPAMSPGGMYGAAFSPANTPAGVFSPGSPGYSPGSPAARGDGYSPMEVDQSYSPSSPSYSPSSPSYSPSSPSYSPSSPSYSPSSPSYSPSSPSYSPSSPSYSPSSPSYSPSSPSYSPSSPSYSPSSPSYSPSSPSYSPSSPSYSPSSPSYSPSSPSYSPSSPSYSPSSPSYSPSSPSYSPSSPSYSPSSPSYSPSSPSYSPSSPSYSPSSPSYSPSSPSYSPSSPSYSPSSPSYSPSSPSYSPSSPSYSPSSPSYSPSSPSYSPSSPSYSPTSPQ